MFLYWDPTVACFFIFHRNKAQLEVSLKKYLCLFYFNFIVFRVFLIHTWERFEGCPVRSEALSLPSLWLPCPEANTVSKKQFLACPSFLSWR